MRYLTKEEYTRIKKSHKNSDFYELGPCDKKISVNNKKKKCPYPAMCQVYGKNDNEIVGLCELHDLEYQIKLDKKMLKKEGL